MNRKLKTSLITTLLIGTSLAVILPVVSCASSNENTININKQDQNPTIINELGTTLAKVGKPSATNNQSTLSEVEFKKILRTYTNTDQDVWTKTKAFFKITDNSGKDIFDDAIKSISASGGFNDNNPSTPLNVTIKLETKNGYKANSQDLSYSPIQVGVTSIINLNIARDNNNVNAVTKELLKLIDPSITTNTGIIRKDQFEAVIDKNHAISSNQNLYKALNDHLIITRDENNNRLTLLDIASSYTITGTYPPAGAASNVNLIIVLDLKAGYVVSDQSMISFAFRIGLSQQTLVITQGEVSQLNAIGKALINVVKPGVNNDSIVSRSQFQAVLNTTYLSDTHQAVYQAFDQYYHFTKVGNNQVVTFSQVAVGINILEIAYPTRANQPVKVKAEITLKDEFLANDNTLLTIAEIQIGIAQETIVYSINESELLYNNLGIKFAQTILPSVITNNEVITKVQYQTLTSSQYTNTTHPEIWTDLSQIVEFTNAANNQLKLSFNDVVKSLKIVPMIYPSTVNQTLSITVEMELNDQYVLNPGLAKPAITIQVGKNQVLALVTQSPLSGPRNNVINKFLAVAGLSPNNPFITKVDFDTIRNASYSKTSNPDVWIALSSYFTFTYRSEDEDNFGQAIAFDDAVRAITVSQNYPNAAHQDVNLTVQLHLYDHALPFNPDSLSASFKLGSSYQILSITIGSTAQKTIIANHLAKIANPAFNDTEQTMSQNEFNNIITHDYNANKTAPIWLAFKDYFVFRNLSGTGINFDDVVRNVKVEGTYPPTDQSTNIEVTLTLTLIDTALVNNTSTVNETLIVGKTFNRVVGSVNAIQANNVGRAFAKIANDTFDDNLQHMTLAEFNNILNHDYNANKNSRVWLALSDYFTFKLNNSNVAFTNVITSIAITGNYQLDDPGSNLMITVTLTPNSQYIIKNAQTNPEVLSTSFIVGKTTTRLTIIRNDALKNQVALALAKIANPEFNDLNQRWSNTDLENLTSKTITNAAPYVELWELLGQYYQFHQDNKVWSFNEVVQSVRFEATYPAGIHSDPIPVNLKLVPTERFINNDPAIFNEEFILGRTYQALSYYLGQQDIITRRDLGVAINRLFNPTATSVIDSFDIVAFNEMKAAKVSLTSLSSIYQLFKPLYEFHNYFESSGGSEINPNPIIPFEDIVLEITFETSTYPTSNGHDVKLRSKFQFKKGYFVRDASSADADCIFTDIVVGRAIGV
ncbi:MAG: hypothetical protein ACRCVI_02570 [Mycoplasmoidaceae bacterium]